MDVRYVQVYPYKLCTQETMYIADIYGTAMYKGDLSRCIDLTIASAGGVVNGEEGEGYR